jgi:hypothetical protein
MILNDFVPLVARPIKSPSGVPDTSYTALGFHLL